jgi:EpsI family protein
VNARARAEAAILLVVLLSTGAVAWWLTFRPVADLDPSSIDAMPHELNGWKAVDLEIDQGVADLLRADHQFQRAYLHRQGYTVYVYVGYYGTARGGAPEHTPDVCYPSQGWVIETDEEVQVGGRASGFDVREFLVEKEDELRLVHFWYRTDRESGFTSIWSLRLRQFWGRLMASRGDGALIRLSTPIWDQDIEAARGRLLSLDAAVEKALDGVWPAQREVS